MRFNMRGVDHLRVCGPAVASKLPEKVFPDATPRPANKPIIDRGRRTILGWAIAPAATALQNMHDTADDSVIVRAPRLAHPSAGEVRAVPIAHRSANIDSCA